MDTATTEIYTLSLHDALPIYPAMISRFIPEMAEAEFCGHVGNKGDAVAWGAGLGAAMADLGSYQGHGSVAHRSEEHTSELQSRLHLVCRLLLEKKKIK